MEDWKNGKMEKWNIGILEQKSWNSGLIVLISTIPSFQFSITPLFHYSIIPILHYSNIPVLPLLTLQVGTLCFGSLEERSVHGVTQ